jgi:hypothetical protein
VVWVAPFLFIIFFGLVSWGVFDADPFSVSMIVAIIAGMTYGINAGVGICSAFAGKRAGIIVSIVAGIVTAISVAFFAGTATFDLINNFGTVSEIVAVIFGLYCLTFVPWGQVERRGYFDDPPHPKL